MKFFFLSIETILKVLTYFLIFLLLHLNVFVKYVYRCKNKKNKVLTIHLNYIFFRAYMCFFFVIVSKVKHDYIYIEM